MIRVCSGATIPSRRSMVYRMSGAEPASGSICFGRALVDKGQNLVPDPPASTAAQFVMSRTQASSSARWELLSAAWVRSYCHRVLEQLGNRGPVSPQLEEELSDVDVWLDQNRE